MRECIEKSTIGLSKDGIKCQRALAGSTDSSDHSYLTPWNTQINMFEIVFVRAFDFNRDAFHNLPPQIAMRLFQSQAKTIFASSILSIEVGRRPVIRRNSQVS